MLDTTENRTAQLKRLFVQKHGQPETTGWAPRRRYRFEYYLPADIYEWVVDSQVTKGCVWLDVGGGRSIFPENPELAKTLVSRASRVVAVDPSENVHDNPFVHERVASTLEEYQPSDRFDLATMRMVVEHVSDPPAFAGALSRLVRPDGRVVVFTVNRWSPISLMSRALSFKLHHPIKRFFWGGEEEDTFPVHYRMNTRGTLRSLFEDAGFVEEQFLVADDLSLFGQFRWLNYMELLTWRALKGVGLHYPENCLLGVYRKRSDEPRIAGGR